MKKTPTSTSAGRGLLRRVGAALFLLTTVLGCLAPPEDKSSGLTPPPDIAQLSVLPSSVNFTSQFGSAPQDQSIDITGASGQVTGLGVGTILYSPIVSGWLSVSNGGAQSTPASMVLRVTPPADLAPGTYTASVPVVSTVTGVITRYVLATFDYEPGPVLQISPNVITIGADVGGANPAPQIVDVANGGVGVLSGLSAGPVIYGAGATGWLTAALTQNTAPAQLTLQAQTAGLAAGTYVAQVPVASTLAGTVPDTVTVSFGVSALSTPPTIVLSPTVIPVSAVAGGADPATQNVSISNGGGGTLDGLGLGAITYIAGPASGWLTASVSGTTAPATLVLQPTTGSLVAGTYTATVRVNSTLPVVHQRLVTVNFTVGSAAQPPLINLSPNNASFVANVGGSNPTDIIVDVANGGGGNLALLSLGGITYGVGATGWLSANLSNTTAPATVALQADITGIPGGTYNATVPVNSGVTGVASQNLTVNLTIIPAVTLPSIALAPLSRTFTAIQGAGNPASTAISVTNNGGGTLSGLAIGTIGYTGGANGWLAATLNQATAPATITLQPTTGTLAPGSYHATVPVTSGVASNSPQIFTVDFTVTAASGLALSPASAAFTGTTGQPSPSPKTISVINTGGGSITGLAVGAITYGGGQTGWLNANLSATTTPASLVLTTTTGTILAGNYTADFNVNSSAGSKPVSVTFAVAAGSGTLAIQAGEGQTVLVDAQVPITLRARVYDAAGNPKPGVNVVWQVNNGGELINPSPTTVTNAQGEVSSGWKVGPLAGTHTVELSSAGLSTVTFEADVQLPSNPNAHPNEPAGFVRFAEHNFSSVPTYPKTLGGLAGVWRAFPLGDPDLLVVTPDLTAPESPPNVLSARFPKGLPAGSGPVSFGGWDAAGTGPAGQKSKVYFSMWIKGASNDYENQSVGTKMGFFGAATSPTAATHNSWFFLRGNGSNSVVSSSPVELHQTTQSGPINLSQNVDHRYLMTYGPWHHWEALLEINTLGQNNGRWRWWIDGILVMDYQNLAYIYTGATNHFFDFNFNPTWGGTGGSRTREDFFKIDHLYMSGVP